MRMAPFQEKYIPPQWTVFYTWFNNPDEREDAIARAKEFVKYHRLTPDDVKIVQDGNDILVRTKREICITL